VLYSVLLKNTVYGCIRGFKSYVVIKGLGYKLMQSKSNIQLRLGYSHNIVYQPPSGISISVLPKKSKALKIFGVDYQQVKEVVARLKSFKKNSVYKYQGVYSYKEKVKLKDSKKKAK
jgi:large subunit ribosomal protein L6